jgi:hypothetical protein
MKWLAITGLILASACNHQEQITTSPAQSAQIPQPTAQEKSQAKSLGKPLMQPDGGAFTPSYLLIAYESNEISADQLYKGKRLFVHARVERVGRDALGKPYVILRNEPWEGKRTTFRSVQAFFPDSAVTQLAHLQPNDDILLSGTCDGLTLNVLLQDSVLEYASSFLY